MEQVNAAIALDRSLTSVHQQGFAAVKPPTADAVEPVDERAFHKQHARAALEGVPRFALSARREAKERGREAALVAIRDEQARRGCERDADQARLDETWRLLVSNDPATVMYALEEAFEDNDAPAVPIDCSDGLAAVVMVLPSADLIPEQKPALTPTGRPTMHKRSKTERNDLYARIMASNILATVREGFATAPNLRRVAVLTVCKDDSIGGIPMLSALSLVAFDRELVKQFQWQRLDLLATLNAATPCLLNRKGRAGDLMPLDLANETDIAEVLLSAADMLGLRIDPRSNLPEGAIARERPIPAAASEPPAAPVDTPPVADTATADLGDSQPHRAPRFCTACGVQVADGARFCTACGAAVVSLGLL